LVDFLAAQSADQVTLSFTEIEALIGRPLSISATQSQAWWIQASQRHVRDLRATGRRAHLDIKAHSVSFERLDAGTALDEGA
jgi:hypothetical protein